MSPKENKEHTSSSSSSPRRLLCFLYSVLLTLAGTAAATLLIVQHAYHHYVVPIMNSNQRGAYIGDFYQDLSNEFTYYNRKCTAADISTTDANDLLVPPDEEHPSQRMLQHGAVALKGILNNETATALRNYLVTRHAVHQRGELPYNEKFWAEMNRLSLGIGTNDDPSIVAALQQVGSNELLKRTLEDILGPDPAIVEISTLTSLYGATNQGLHTDSDWFGSSLLYARSFLHSYSLFIALQDTSRALGPTTVCPGTHVCADQDLEDVCMENGAFEVSTNGYTGDDGVLLKGDALLFNQNIWHRGPESRDPQRRDRIMFIMTFASRTDKKGDNRKQGMGTYYYQRWNMWGHTFNDLKRAGTAMNQPWAALRALGLWVPRGAKLGVTWIEQFCQQMANGEEFYAEWELPVLNEDVLDSLGVPSLLRSESEDWREFINETIHRWVLCLAAVNMIVIFIGLLTTLMSRLPGTTKQTDRIFILGFFKSGVCAYLLAAVAGTSFLVLVERSPLADFVRSGDVSVRPFPVVSGDDPRVLEFHLGSDGAFRPATLPDRGDVLIGTRYDSNFLASYNRFLDFHPGNKRWKALVSQAAQLEPSSLQNACIRAVVSQILTERNREGVRSRFLLQDAYSGKWRILNEADAVQETRKEVTLHQHGALVQKLVRHLRNELSLCRFGPLRDLHLSRVAGSNIKQWEKRILAMEDPSTVTEVEKIRSDTIHVTLIRPLATLAVKRSLQVPTTVVASYRMARTRHDFDVGHCVWVREDDGKWYQGDIWYYYGGDMYEVKYSASEFTDAHINDLRQCEAFKEGDYVEVDYYHNEREYYPGTIASVHPDGRFTIQYEDGEIGLHVDDAYVLPLYK